MSRIRIALAHSQRLLLDGLGALIQQEPSFELVWSGTNSETLLESVLRLAPEVTAVELEMPRLTGLEVARRLRQGDSKSSLLVLGERRSGAAQHAVEQAGGYGFLPTDSTIDQLFEALRAAAERRPVSLLGRTSAPEWKDRIGVEVLSAREVEVLRALSDGFSSREIAEQLSISFRTVDGYRASLMDKLFIRTVPGLVKFAIRHRLTDLEG